MSWNEIARTEWKEQPHLLILPQKWFLSPLSSYLPPSDKWPSATHRCPCAPLVEWWKGQVFNRRAGDRCWLRWLFQIGEKPFLASEVPLGKAL